MNKLYAHLQIIKKEDAKDIIMEIINQYPEGVTIEDISEQIHIDQKHLNTIIEEMIKNGTLETRDGRYFVVLPEKMRKNECWDAPPIGGMLEY
jgi:predicted transcriptional regulator